MKIIFVRTEITNFILNVYIFSDPEGRKERPQHPQGKTTDVSLVLALKGWLIEELCICEFTIKRVVERELQDNFLKKY